jgi:SAM-dependent methyltransferase
MIDLYRERPDLYDLLHDGEMADVTFYVGLARALAPARGTVLELGCGTGRVMDALLEQGLHVTGLDGEPAMLARARRRLARYGDRARLVHADMRRPELGPQRFDLVLVSANTFMHLEDHAAQRACLRGVHAHLSEGGAAVLDLANPFHLLALPQGVVSLRRQVHDDATGHTVAVFGSLEADATAPHAVDRLFFDDVGPDGLVRRLACTVELRLVFMPELELLLASCGLGIADAYGDYDLGPYHAASERMIAVVRRLA